MESAAIPKKQTDRRALGECMHCGVRTPEGVQFCCIGCESAYHAVHSSGISAADHNNVVFSALATQDEQGSYQLTLSVRGIHCASCIQLIENALYAQEDIITARVNMTTERLTISWRGKAERADAFVQIVRKLGYGVEPFDASRQKSLRSEEEKFLLSCIAVSAFSAGNLMMISVGLWSSTAETMGFATRDFLHWISALIALPTILYAGRPFFYSAFAVLKERHTNMDVPISLAIILASGMSLLETISHGEHVYFDSAVMLTFFLLIGRYLDARAKGKAKETAQELLTMLSGTATVLQDNKRVAVPIRDLREGMTVLVASGENIAADGVITQGETELDMSLITGETIPGTAKKSDAVFAGTVNLAAPIRISVSKATENNLLSDIVKLMEKAEQGQAHYVRLADKAAKLYTPVVHTMGLVTFLGWWLLMGEPWQSSLLIAITVLIITCPCALGLAVPVVQVLASSKLMKQGVLLKSGDALEKLSNIDVAVFDKTGTLTLGKPELIDIKVNSHEPAKAVLHCEDDNPNREQISNVHHEPAKAVLHCEDNNPNREQISNVHHEPAKAGKKELQLAASIASHSKHPLSQAICKEYSGELITADSIKEFPGKGIEALIDGKKIRLGSRKWCGDKGKHLDDAALELWLSVQGEDPTCFTFADTLREDTKQVISQFKQAGIRTVLLSGDRKEVVSKISEEVGIEEHYAELSPVEKCDYIEQLKQEGHYVAMLGDGLNDAPSLAAADVSISPSTAIDIAQNTADIVFQGERLSPAFNTWKVAGQSKKLVKQNFALAVVYNIIAIPLAVMGHVTPLIAAIAMSGSSLVVIGNSFRLNLNKTKKVP
jgi:Cu2+-exporting ATPase